MDDYNISAISEAKNEYSARLVNILSPLLIEGIKSIFKEALELCITNSEKDKYLMTFQNFLTRVPKWNQAIITQETTRIISKSGCNYLEDLVTCVHISQLKILTSIRVASKQKKVDIDIPKLSEFIHYCYIQFARKLYSNVYLFETKVSSLQMQKNHRECELLCKECILNVIRNNIPVDKILRAYIDETTEEEEIVEESKVEEKPVAENPPSTPIDIQKVDDKPDATPSTNEENVKVEKKLPSGASSENKEIVKEEIKKTDIPPPVPPNSPAAANITTQPKVPTNLSFNDKDKVINYNKKETTSAIQSNTAETIIAPKTLKRLEEISVQRHKERKEEDADDDDDEKIKILDTPVGIKLGELDIHVLDDKVSLQKEVLKDIIPLK